ncbi:MAG: hypothetical protein SXA11_01875 [Cyanobacteriota bacterium]|nr:hypothetical protein [Cyanobacteriota bacterium]
MELDIFGIVSSFPPRERLELFWRSVNLDYCITFAREVSAIATAIEASKANLTASKAVWERV